MRWLLDQGLPRGATALLRRLGHDAVHVGDLNLSMASDSEILLRGFEEDRVVATLDADFHAILAQTGAGKPSVVRIREEGLKAGELAEILSRIAGRFETELSKGCLLTYLKATVRIRAIPLK